MNIPKVLRSPWLAVIPGTFLVTFFWDILLPSTLPRETWNFIYWVGGGRFANLVADAFFHHFCVNRECPGLGLDGGPYQGLELSILLGCILLWSAVQATLLVWLGMKFIAFYNKGAKRQY